jgi:hypothetical protein
VAPDHVLDLVALQRTDQVPAGPLDVGSLASSSCDPVLPEVDQAGRDRGRAADLRRVGLGDADQGDTSPGDAPGPARRRGAADPATTPRRPRVPASRVARSCVGTGRCAAAPRRTTTPSCRPVSGSARWLNQRGRRVAPGAAADPLDVGDPERCELSTTAAGRSSDGVPHVVVAAAAGGPRRARRAWPRGPRSSTHRSPGRRRPERARAASPSFSRARPSRRRRRWRPHAGPRGRPPRPVARRAAPGTQSATWTPSGRSRLGGHERVDARSSAPGGVVASTTPTSAPWTWPHQVPGGSGIEPVAVADRGPVAGEVTRDGGPPVREVAGAPTAGRARPVRGR